MTPNLMQEAVPEGLRNIRQECHGWACLLTTLVGLENSTVAPQMQQDLQLEVLQRFPASAYISYQTATLCAVSVMPTRLRICSRLLLRQTGATAHPNLQLLPVIECCAVKGDFYGGRCRLGRLIATRSLQRRKLGLDVAMGPLDALRRATSTAAQGSDVLPCCTSGKPFHSCTVYNMSRSAVLQLAYIQMVKASHCGSSNDSLHLGISARHRFRWCKGVWLLSSWETADSMDDKDMRYFGEQLKWSGIILHASFDEFRLMFTLTSQGVKDNTTVID